MALDRIFGRPGIRGHEGQLQRLQHRCLSLDSLITRARRGSFAGVGPIVASLDFHGHGPVAANSE